jgi:diguanylate cyclase (GGDEF)-like protein/PAS domain S-box-containing protein
MSKLNNWIFGGRNRIGRRLIVLIVAFSSLITLVNSVVELMSEYHDLRNSLDRELEELNIYVPSLSGSVWDFDEKQIQLSLDALALLANIDRVSVVSSSDRKTWVAGKQLSSNIVTRTYSLRHNTMGQDTEIGRLEVVASLSAIHRQVAERAVAIILSNGIKTFLVALFMAYLFRRLVTGRLEQLARKVTLLVPQKSSADDSAPRPEHLDELAMVEWTLDRTAQNLASVVDELRVVNEQLHGRISEQDALLQNALVGIVMVRAGFIVFCNRRFEEMVGFEADKLIGQSIQILFPAYEQFSEFDGRVQSTLEQGLSFSGSFKMVRRQSGPFWAEMSGRALDSSRPELGSIWIFSDITDRKAVEEKNEFLAYHDALTGLPNRLLFADRFKQAMAYADRAGSKVALLFLDLDNFKTINDSLGHAVGDGLIQHVAARLKECVRDTDTVSRQGGDEFLIVLPNLTEADATAGVAVKIMERLLDSWVVDGHDLNTSVSIGIAIYPDDGRDFDTLMKKADMAMYRAKDGGRNAYRFFDEHMDVDALEQLNIRNGLRRALARGEFSLHYQPQIALADDSMIGVEALLRWDHPEWGMVSPAKFIPVAEDSGLIVQIGEWVLHEACRQLAAWQKAGLPNMVIAVNLSAVQFRRGDVVKSVFSAINQSGIDPRYLELELTESILIGETDAALATMMRLKRLGVKLSIDDFGTGYSSLSYLKRFQVDKLKIDQSFVRGLANNPEDTAIVRTIIQMAKSFGLQTIAEGVEDQVSLDLLRGLHCDVAQGYFFARPMAAADLPSYLGKASATVG